MSQLLFTSLSNTATVLVLMLQARLRIVYTVVDLVIRTQNNHTGIRRQHFHTDMTLDNIVRYPGILRRNDESQYCTRQQTVLVELHVTYNKTSFPSQQNDR